MMSRAESLQTIAVRGFRSMAATALILLFAGCGSDEILTSLDRTVTGVTAWVQAPGSRLILLREVASYGTSERLMILLEPETRVYREEQDGSLTRIKPEDIGLERSVRAWRSSDDEIRTLPPTVYVSQVVVLRE